MLSLAAGLVPGAAGADVLDGVEAFKRADYEAALKNLRPAAQEGDAEANFTLGTMFESGRGVAKDAKKAAEHYLAAAEKGLPSAQHKIGSALMLGEGIDQDMVEALKWFLLASEGGSKESAVFAESVARFMPRQMQFEARRKARDWKAEKNPPKE